MATMTTVTVAFGIVALGAGAGARTHFTQQTVVGVVGVAGGELADFDVDGDGSDGLADGEAGTAMVDAPVGGTWPQPVMPSTAAEPAITAAAIRCLFWGPPRRIITTCWNLRTAIPGATR